jgi:acetyl esterase/lipase
MGAGIIARVAIELEDFADTVWRLGRELPVASPPSRKLRRAFSCAGESVDMKHRKRRFVWSVTWGTAAVLLCGAAIARAKDEFKITPDVVYGHKAGMALTFDVIQPKDPNGAGVLFMVSGGWVSSWTPPQTFMDKNGPEIFKHFHEIIDRGYTLFIVRHGSSPQFKVPEAVADVRRAVRYIRLHAADFKVDPDRLGVCGGSAGGHLSLMLGTASDEGGNDSTDEVDRTSDRVACVVAYFPPVDLREWVGDKRFPALDFDPKQAESVSPLLFVTKDDAPTLLIHGDKDDLVKIKNSEQIQEAFKREGVPCDLIVMHGGGHGYAGEQPSEAFEALIKWFDKYLAPKASGNEKTAEPAAAESH